MCGGEVDPHRGQLPVGVGRQLHLLDLAPTLHGGLGALGALFDPADRDPVLVGQRDTEELLGVHLELGAEATTHRRCHHSDLLFGKTQREGPASP